MKCEHENHPDYECKGEIKMRKAMTAYHFEGVKNSPEDPNRDFAACEEHYEAYVEHWTEMWNEYYSSMGNLT